MKRRGKWLGLIAFVAALASVGCESALSYYPHLAFGQLRLLAARRDVAEVLADPATPPALAHALGRVEGHLKFAQTRLRLPVGGRYQSYVQLKREAVVWNVFAAPEFSVAPVRWRHPLIGAAAYRGFFDLERAQRAAQSLAARGFDTQVSGAAAYSTLGWFDDPLLSTFINLPDARLAELLFHELAHGALFTSGDTAFNEAFATFVGQRGTLEWLAAQGRDAQPTRAAFRARVDQAAFLLAWRDRFAALYARPLAEDQRRILKARLFAEMRACYAQRPGAAALPRHLNNAVFVAVAAYQRWTGAFAAIFDAAARQWPAFHAQAKAIGELPAPERAQRLAALAARDAEAAGNQATPAELTCRDAAGHAAIAVDWRHMEASEPANAGTSPLLAAQRRL